jgi:putative salt-induced outer membrane protein YdiY
MTSHHSALLRLAQLAAAAALALPALSHAQATVKPDGQFRASLGLGASLTSGNTRSTSFALAGDAVRATEQDKISLYGSSLYARSAGVTSAEQLRLGSRYDYNLTPLWFGFGGLDFERNKLANLKLRSQLSGGVGYHLLKTPTTVWDLFGGVAYSSDRFVEPTLIDSAVRTSYGYPSLLLGEESSHKLSDSTSARQRFVLYPNLKNSGEFRATWDAALSVAMSRAMNLTVGLGLAHNSDPGLGRKSTDMLLTSGVNVKFE